MDAQLGSIEVGKDADLTAFDLSALETQPVYDPLSHLVYACGREQVSDVWIAGQHVVRMRQPVYVSDETEISVMRAQWAAWQNEVGLCTAVGGGIHSAGATD
jgi:5-methylthioadenosine/S-adenosylhomocysteine deaminase